MTFRTRLMLAITAAATASLVLLALVLRQQLRANVVAQYNRRAQVRMQVARQDLEHESADIALRLAALAGALPVDDHFRLAAIRGDPDERTYLLDYAAHAMRVSGFDLLQLQDSAGRILSSGHFRNEFNRLEPALLSVLASAGANAVALRARAPEGPFVALVRIDSVRVAGRVFHLIGGTAIDSAFYARLGRDTAVTVSLIASDSAAALSRPADVNSIPLSYVDASGGEAPRMQQAHLAIVEAPTDLETLLDGMNRRFAAVLLAAILASVALGAWLSARLSEPLSQLAGATTAIDLDGSPLRLPVERDDEFGALARRMGAMATRLRAAAARLRSAERRATVGDMARQVNHDIRNGLVPIRNVLRHLEQVREHDAGALAGVFAERRQTLFSGVEYLDTLARNYARLAPQLQHMRVDLNASAGEVAGLAADNDAVAVRTKLSPGLPALTGDPVQLRRIVENLVRNAVEACNTTGTVTILTSQPSPDVVRLTVADTGCGMTEEQMARASQDWFTTKPLGTGLGLSVVRRLTADLRGTLRMESKPGAGTRVTIDFPVER